ncbi:MAG TPA: hypothetical protein VN043_11115 [Rhodanobacter sp.]|nr:hypothetical protein [Rhodanobacter sp.]
MSKSAKHVHHLMLATSFMLPAFAAGSASASDASDVNATIQKWVADMSKGDLGVNSL